MHQKHTDDNDERGYRSDGDQRHDQNHEVDDDNTTDDNTINVQNHLGIHGRTTRYTLIVSILSIVLQYILNDR